jgi:ankyrin repeat protein
MFCAFLTTKGGEKTQPALLVRSGMGQPEWVSPSECQKLAVGMSSFRCCDLNHMMIQEGERERCLRPTSLEILDRMIRERATSFFSSNNFAEARACFCMRNYWCRGLIDDVTRMKWNSLEKFKSNLRWTEPKDQEWFDREHFPFLIYAVLTDCIRVVQEAVIAIMKIAERKTRKRCMQARIILSLGLTGGCTALVIAMICANSGIVSLLLEHGADPFESDIAGNDPLMFAAIFGNVSNVRFWLDRFPDWDLERRNKLPGGVALGHAVFMGPRRLELVKLLHDRGARLDWRADNGDSILISLCLSEDVDLEVLKLLLKEKVVLDTVNDRICGNSFMFKSLYSLARFLVRTKLTNIGVVKLLAQYEGSTALSCAVRRGDIDVVNLLITHGADPSIKNKVGMCPLDYCDAFPELRGALKRVIYQRREKKAVTLVRRDSST